MPDETLPLPIDAVWEAIPVMEWATPERIHETSGVDEQRIDAILNFLIRWKFVDESGDSKFSVRRRAGVMSPTSAFVGLRTLIEANMNLGSSPRQACLAERVACRACGGRNFNFLKHNLIECGQCGERQWYTIRIGGKSRIQEQIATVSQAGWLRHLLNR